MSAVSELIDVKFVDNTNYPDTSGSDVIGCVFDHCWGPIGQMRTYSQSDFFKQYPEGLPYGWNPLDSARFYSYVQIKKAYNSAGGAGLVEAYRLNGNWKYFNVALCGDSSSVSADTSRFTQSESGVYQGNRYSDAYNGTQFRASKPTNSIMQVALRFPGFFPYAGDFNSFKDFRLDVTFDHEDSLNPCILSLYGVSRYGRGKVGSSQTDEYIPSADNLTLLERFYGSFNPSATADGASFYLIDIINSQSRYIRVQKDSSTFYGVSSEEPQTVSIYLNSVTASDGLYYPLLTYSDIYEDGASTPEGESFSVFSPDKPDVRTYLELIEDPETSAATMFVAPVPFKCDVNPTSQTPVTVSADDDPVLQLFLGYSTRMELRKDATFVWGYPTDVAFDYDHIKCVGAASAAWNPSKFTTFFAGREAMTVYGMPIYLDCTAGVAGRTIAVAKSSHINQLASARLYGTYPGTLSETLSFSAVQDLHKNHNINSVYSTPNGNYIFGIKNNFERMNSYFAKLNVTRVINWILKLTYPIVLNAIHTETVSDDNTRLQFLFALKDVLRSMTPANIKEESDVRIETDDAKTRGGEEIILYYDIWFKKLAEHCTITIAATDSSVNVTVQ